MKQPAKLSVTTVKFEAFGSAAEMNLIVAAFGYESRACQVTRRLLDRGAEVDFASVDFLDLRAGGGRDSNDAFIAKHKIDAKRLYSDDYLSFEVYVLQRIHELQASPDRRLAIHFDYSCMPRTWYCNLAVSLLSKVRPEDRLVFWYTPGRYNEKAFQPAGIDDFDVFSGQSSLSPQVRTHILGLGFEGVRAQAIISVLDPEYLVCYYADPGVNQQYVDRAVGENSDLLSTAQQFIRLPLPDFSSAYTRLRAVACEFRTVGDVILVPDGPKPLVLAASLIPFSIEQPGVTCLHVRRRVRKPEAALDVEPADDSYGAVVAPLALPAHG